LCSIKEQTIIDDIDVTIVNDLSSDGDYSKFVDMFKPYMSIREIKTNKNGGPGVARQYGIDNTHNPLICFIDADDTFSGSFALKVLRENMLKTPTCAICIGKFLEEQLNNHYVLHENDTVWMFGKLYKRDFLNSYGIRFNETRANEDNGFNMMCKLFASPKNQIKFIQDTIYYWHFKKDSITRINNFEYSFNQSFVGYTDNMIYALKYATKKDPKNKDVTEMKIKILCNLYGYFIETIGKDTRFIEQNWECCKKYYNEVCADIKDELKTPILAKYYNEVMKNSQNMNKFKNFLPAMSLMEFINNLAVNRTINS